MMNSPARYDVRHCFYDFCKQTILHGWHYLAEGSPGEGGGANGEERQQRPEQDGDEPDGGGGATCHGASLRGLATGVKPRGRWGVW